MALDIMYKLGTAIHRNLYDLSLLRKVRLTVPVFGVGNLSFGGSGKTLVTETIARKLASEGKHVGVVCRSYGAEPGPHILSDNNCDPYVVGDEAAMLFAEEAMSEEPGARMMVTSARDKTRAAQALVEQCPDIDVVVVDDAFQHHRLHQDLRIVIWPKPGALLRDFLSAADRSDILLVPNGLRSPRPERETVFFVKEFFGVVPAFPSPLAGEAGWGVPIRQNIHPHPSSPLKGEEVKMKMGTEGDILTNTETLHHVGDSILLVAGLGPESDFFHHARKNFPQDGVRITECVFPDHVDYRRPEIQARLTAAAAGCDAILTTAKDAVKLRRLVPGFGGSAGHGFAEFPNAETRRPCLAIPLPPIYVVRVGIKFLTNEGMLWEKIRTFTADPNERPKVGRGMQRGPQR